MENLIYRVMKDTFSVSDFKAALEEVIEEEIAEHYYTTARAILENYDLEELLTKVIEDYFEAPF